MEQWHVVVVVVEGVVSYSMLTGRMPSLAAYYTKLKVV
jgi:hypothetical protein